MPRRRSLPDLLTNTAGSTTIEFVIVFVVFMGIVFFVVEVTLYMFFMASLEKAAEAGARAAVVSSPVAPGVPLQIARQNNTEIFGYKCSHVSDPCVDLPTVTCTGAGGCSAGDFDRILQHMRRFNGQIQAANVSVTYSDAGIGFAGGPAAPMVTVTVSGVPFQAGILELLLLDPSGIATLPARSAGMTGEDLAP